jgi:prevent-host-death family protein
MDTVSATDLHDRTSELTEQAMREPDRPIIVERHGKPAVVLVDARYFEGLLETLDLLADSQAMKLLNRGLEDERAGRLIDHGDLMRELGLHEQAARYDRMVAGGSRRAAKRRKPNRSAKNRAKGARRRRIA